MINFSVSRPPRALIFRAGWGKKTILSVPFLPILSPSGGRFRNSRPLFNFSRRREEDVNKNGLSLSSSSSFFKLIPKTDNADGKNQQKNCLFMRIMKIKSWIACVGIRVGMFISRAFFFLHACKGLLIVPGRETKKLIVVPISIWMFFFFFFLSG